MKKLQATIYLANGEYEKAKAMLETLPEWLVELKYDAIARTLKGKDRVNGAAWAKCIYMENAYQMCKIQGDGWFHMEEDGVIFQTVPVEEYIPTALTCYKEGRDIIEAFVGDDPINQHSYVWEGMQTFHWSFYQAIAGCYKKLGNIEECEKAINEAYRIISIAWDDFEENKKLYMDPFYQYLKDYDLAEYIR